MSATQPLDETAVERPAQRPALLPERVRAVRRPHWWQEIFFIAATYGLYSLVRNAVPSQEHTALHRAADLLRIETSLHLDVERSLNELVRRSHWLAYACNYYYATLHFVVTIAVMAWLYRRHPLRYRSARTVLIATTVTALLGFWLFALAPPRMLAGKGFVDTIVHFHTWGSWGSSGVDSASNQFAAMPSLHIAWAAWCGIAIFTLARHRVVKALGVAYPVATLFVILGTANHFLFDAVGGLVVLGAGFAVQRALSGRPAFAPPPRAVIAVPAQPKNTRS